MKQNLRYSSNPEKKLLIYRKFLVYKVLQNYYSGNLWTQMENWEDILIKLAETRYQEEIELFREGMRLVVNPDKQSLYDFNKLFIGPEKLKAPPYESFYRNSEGLLMQKETLDVREFYSTAGLSVANQNSEPDDFIAFEFEFMSFLLYNVLFSLHKDNHLAKYYLKMYLSFLDQHLGKWVFDHCKDILTHSTSDFCKGMALITKGFVQHELNYKEEIL